MNNEKFVWGKVISRITLDFDGEVLEVVKYHPRKVERNQILRGVYTDDVNYHCEEMSSSFSNLMELIINWITYKNLGINERGLATGICRALRVGEKK